METTIDSVVVEIESSADKSNGKLNELITTLNKLEQSIKGPLTSLISMNTTLSNMPNKLNEVTDKIKKVNNEAGNTKNLDGLKSKLSGLVNVSALVAGSRILTKTIGEAVNKSSDYIANLNLLYNSLGKNATQAKKFADNFSEVLGVDPSEVYRYISLFNSLASGFGIASDKAYIMSKNLTQLSYDMSAYLNIPISDAMQKIKSGFSGEIEPMRAVGIALDQATLQQTAYTLGIQKRVSEMTRAQKTELLYYQMMSRSTQMQGYMGKTLLQPANAIRVLKQQFTLLARAIGNIFLPIVMKVIPYVMVLTKWLTTLAQRIAAFFGFELPDIDTSNLSDISAGIEDIGDSASGTTKELKKMLAPFDELNVIEFDKNSGSGAGSSLSGGDLGIPLLEYDALANALTKNMDEIEQKLKRLIPLFAGIGAGIATWKVGSSVLNFLDKIGLVKDLGGALKIMAGISLIITGVTITYGSIKNMLNGDLSAQNLLMGIGGSALTGLGAGLIFGGPVGWTIAIALTLLVTAIWIFKKDKENMKAIAKTMGVDYDSMGLKDKIKFRMDLSLEVLGIKETSNPVTQQIRTWMAEKIAKPVQEFFAPLTTWIDEHVAQPIKKIFDDVWSSIGAPLQNLWKQITDTFTEAKETVQAAWEKIIPFFEEIWNGIKDRFVNAWEIIKGVWQTVQPFFQGVWEGIKNVFSVVKEFFSGMFGTAWEAVKAHWTNAINFFSGVWSGIKAVFSVVKGVLTGDFSSAWDSIKNVWTQARNFFQGVWDGIKNVFGSVSNWFQNTFATAWQAVKNVFSSGGQIFEGIKEGIANTLTTVINAIIRGINSVIRVPFNALNSILRKLKQIEILGMKPFDWVYTFSVPQIPTFAQGGFPDTGEAFIARENGPELVGRIGNKSAVANNDQIIAGISQGVSAGVSEAMATSNGRQPVNVYIGNKKVYSGYGEYANTENNMYGKNVIRV